MSTPASHVLAETDLYCPVRDYLAQQGYTVRGEVHHCDVAAVRGEELIVIELKRGLTLALLAQAVQRQQLTDSVYVAIPRPENKRKWMAQTADVQAVLKRLELGLLLVSLSPSHPPVEVILHPLPATRRRRKRAQRALLAEIARRSGDFHQGGGCRQKLVTAYRENAIHIACCLAELGPLSPRALRARGTGSKTLAILYRNVYAWFTRTARGVYALSEQGQADLAHYPALAARFRVMVTSAEPAAMPAQQNRKAKNKNRPV